MLVFKSMAILQKEKLVVIEKELQHLWHISDFYRPLSSTEKKDQSQTEIISNYIYEDITTHFNSVNNLNEKIDRYLTKYIDHKNYLYFLTLYDHYNKEISELLNNVRYLQSKFLQFQHEHFNQYIPIPNINKRYSSKGFLDYLKDYHTQILKGEHESLHHPITLWGYIDSFKAHSLSQKKKVKYIEIPYWNYEISFMLPFITHEMGHIVLNHKDEGSELGKIKKILKKSEILNNIFKYNESLLEEVLSDFFALLHHGESYIIAMAHALLGLEFSEQFYSKNINSPVAINQLFTDNTKFIEALIRLSIAINFYDELEPANNKDIDNNNNTILVIKNIKDILKWILIETNGTKEDDIINAIDSPEKSEKENLGKIYHTYYGLTDEYINFYVNISKYVKAIMSAYYENHDSLQEHIKTIKERIKDNDKLSRYKDSFQVLTEDRMKSININTNENTDIRNARVMFKHKLRKIILEKDGVLSQCNSEMEIGSSYELVLFKTRMDRFLKSSKSYLDTLSIGLKKEHNSVLIDDNCSIEPKFVFDYYSMLVLVKKREGISVQELNTYLKDIKNKSEDKTIKYYANKFSFILLDYRKFDAKPKTNVHSVKIQNSDKSKEYLVSVVDNTKCFSTFINLSLKTNNSDKTKTAKDRLNTMMKELSFKDIEYEIYKSLGPKEIVIHLRNMDIDTLFKAKKDLFQKNDDIFHRSYTIIYFDLQNKDNIYIDDQYKFRTVLRAKTGKNDTIFDNDNILNIDMTTGVKDYSIEWKAKTSISQIINYYDKLIEEGSCTDIQTFISMRIY